MIARRERERENGKRLFIGRFVAERIVEKDDDEISRNVALPRYKEETFLQLYAEFNFVRRLPAITRMLLSAASLD